MSLFDDFQALPLSHLDEILGPSPTDEWMHALSEEAFMPGTTDVRVCDRCIAKKIKCDLQRPTCSRCKEARWNCVYSSIKKRPGPATGSRQKKRSTSKRNKNSNPGGHVESPVRAEVFSEDRTHGVSCMAPEYVLWPVTQSGAIVSQSALSQPESVNIVFPPSGSEGSPETLGMVHPISTNFEAGSFDPQLTPDQEGTLLHYFLLHLHSSIPLFRKAFFLQQYQCGSISRELVLAICVISAKVMGTTDCWSPGGLERYVKYLLETNTMEDTPSTWLSLDNFRQAALLAFYEFYQQPGEKAVMRIGQLTQKAYQCGLHQLDNPEQCPLLQHKAVSEDEVEEWRYIWWCIYCLDSCSNIMAAAPFLVENESIKTALVANSLPGLEYSPPQLASTNFLPADTSQLPQTIKAIAANPGDCNYNIRIVATTILREAAKLRRLHVQNPSEGLRARIAALESHLSSMRNALPERFMNDSRHVMANETSSEHFARLVSVLLIHFVRIIVTLPSGAQQDELEWLYRWHRTLEYCEDIVAVLSQWDEHSLSPVDPVVCIIVSGTLTLLHLHSCSRSTDPATHGRIAVHKHTLLTLQLRFTSAWHLGRCLLSSFNRFSQLTSGQLAPKDIDQIMTYSQGPLHQNIFSLLTLFSEGGV